MNGRLNILLIEDDDVAAEGVQRGLEKYAPGLTIAFAENGREALKILREPEREKQIPWPFIVLLDLNMPVMNGFEFLEEVRNSDDLRNLVIFVLTTSNEDSDKTKAYYHNIAGYMVKSAVGPQYAQLSKLIESYQNAIEMAG